MEPGKALQPDRLTNRCDPADFSFATTADVADLDDSIGQDRAIHALLFGVKMEKQGYNIFALGPNGAGKYTMVHRYAQEQAAEESPPLDWCYVNNFDQPYIPRMLRLPAGKGKEFREDMQHIVEELHNVLSSAFESEEYQARRQALEAEFQERQQESLRELQDQAKERNLTLMRTQGGLAFAPLDEEGNVLEPENFEKLPEEEKERIKSEVEVMQDQLQKILYQVPRWEREFRRRLRELNREVTDFVLTDLLDDLQEKYADYPEVLRHLDAVSADVGENLNLFLRTEDDGGQDEGMPSMAVRVGAAMRRYQVNLLVDSSDAEGAPVIYESNPTYQNLVGRVEQMAQMGALITDFMLIKPGVLHKANGGYLILDARKVLTSPYAWEGLKRALQFQEVRIESPSQMLSLTSTVSLEPEPIPLDIKVILMGDRQLYYLLAEYDPEFTEMFKVAADFDDVIVRNEATQERYARLMAGIVRQEALRPLSKEAVARVVEHSSRLAGDQERLSAHIQAIVDLLEESDHWAAAAGAERIEPQHVQEAIDGQIYRADRIRERMQEQVLRETVLIETDGAKIGQINGLAVLRLGTLTFGKASRITSTVRLGKGEVVDIEREVEMGGPIHSKGVLILASYLRARYAADEPLSLSASLVFEQSYGGVDGDSASSTELYCLLSAIGRAPIKQSLAVTGSVSQTGEVQAIGGVNEKVEAFFDLCNARGLTGNQGVLIPVANVKNLMLRQDVIDAVEAGKFHIYPVETVDQGIALLTGLPAGQADEEGVYPEGTVNRMVADRLQALAEQRRALAKQERNNDES